MYGWLQSGSSITAFSNVNQQDLVIRTTDASAKVVIGCGSNRDADATLYLKTTGVGVKSVPNSLTLFDVAGAFNVSTSSNVSVAQTLTASTLIATSNFSASSATICNLTVGDIQYTSATTQTLVVESNMTVGGDIVPASNMTASLGTASNRFTDLYLSGQSFHIGDTTLKMNENGDLAVVDNTETYLKNMICRAVEVGDSSNIDHIRLLQDDTSGHLKVSRVVGGQEQDISVVHNIWSVNSNIGIGTSNPSHALEVEGDINVTGNFKKNGEAFGGGVGWSNSSSNIFSLSNIGIGKSDPSYSLDVSGSGRVGTLIATSHIARGTTNPEYPLHIYNSNTFSAMFESTDGAAIQMKGASQTWKITAPDSNNSLILETHDGSNWSLPYLCVLPDGKIGIGNTEPLYALDVDGTINASQVLVNGLPISTGEGGGAVATYFIPGTGCNIHTQCNLGIKKTNPQYALDVNGTINATSFLLNNNPLDIGYWKTLNQNNYTMSNVAIGKDTPSYTLDVNGTINATSLLVNGSAVGSGYWQTSGANMYTQSNIGIGNTSPSAKLDVTGDIKSSGTITAATSMSSVSLTLTGAATVGTTTTTKTLNVTGAGWNQGILFNSGPNQFYLDETTFAGVVLNLDVDSNFTIAKTASETPILIVQASTSFVGINKASPSTALDVSGAITATSYCNVSWSMLTNKPSLCNIATTGSWSDIAGKPSFATVATSGSYADLTNKPALCNVATTGAWTDIGGKPSFATVATSGSYADLANTPSLATLATSGDWSDIANKPSKLSATASNDLETFSCNVSFQKNATVEGYISAAAYCNVEYSSIINKPSLSTVATSGQYNDLAGRPTTLASFSTAEAYTFNCNVGIKKADPAYELDIFGTINATTYCNVQWSMIKNAPNIGNPNWTEVQGRPSNLSEFTNDLQTFSNIIHITQKLGVGVPNPSLKLEVDGAITATSYCNLQWSAVQGKPSFATVATSGLYTDLSSKPTKLSDFANDVSNFTCNVGIKTASPEYPLHVTGAIYASAYCNLSVSWSDVSSKPSFCNIATTAHWDYLYGKPTKLTDLQNDLSEISTLQVLSNLGVGKSNTGNSALEVEGAIEATSYCNLEWSMINNPPTIFSGAYGDLSGAPALCNVATTGAYGDLVGKPTLCNIATTASYNDLADKPSLCNVAITGDYNDLANKPDTTTMAWSNITQKPTSLSTIADNDLAAFSNSITIDGNLTTQGQLYQNHTANFNCNLNAFGICKTSNITALDSYGTLNIGCTTSTGTLNLGVNSSLSTINLGTNGSGTTINIGANGDTVNLIGNVVTTELSSSSTSNKTIVVNEGGLSNSAGLAGLEIEEGGLITGYILVSDTRDSFLFSTPTSTTHAVLTVGDNKTTLDQTLTLHDTKVGINTTAPTEALHLKNGTFLMEQSSSNTNTSNTIHFGHTATTSTNNCKITSAYSNDATHMSFYTSTAQQSNISLYLSGGKAAIGKQGTPSATLDVAGDLSLAGTLYADKSTNTYAKLIETDSNSGNQRTTIYAPGNTSNTTFVSILDTKGIGINKAAPTEALDVAGNIQGTRMYSTSGIFVNNAYTYGETSSNVPSFGLGYLPSSSNVQLQGENGITLKTGPTSTTFMDTYRIGIKTNTPQATLDVVGDAVVSTSITTSNISACNMVSLSNQVQTLQTLAIAASNKAFTTSGAWETTASSNTYYTKGSVGVGTSNVTQATLEVQGSIYGQSYCNLQWAEVQNKPTFADVATSGAYSDLSGKPTLCNVATTGAWSDISDKPSLCNLATTASWSDVANKPTNLTAFTNDLTYFPYNTGFGNSNPQYALDVSGTINTSTLLINGTPFQQHVSAGYWSTNDTTMYSMSNVGIGTSSPSAIFEVKGTTARFETSNIHHLVSTLSNETSTFQFGKATSTRNSGFLKFVHSGTDASTANYLQLGVQGETSALTLTGNGRIGINNSTPSYTLDVAGTINATSYCNITWSSVSSKPAFATIATSGLYSDLSNAPSLCNVATSGSYSDLTNKPSYATVATSGSYADLTNKPTALSAFTNDITSFPSSLSIASNLTLENNLTNRKIVLYNGATPSNDHEFIGLGHNANMMRLQLNATTTDMALYVGTASNTSTELLRLKGNTGALGLGTSSPSQKLHISNGNILLDAQASPQIYLKASTDTTTSGSIYWTKSNGNEGMLLRHDATNNTLAFVSYSNPSETAKVFIGTNIGIKTNNPNFDLDVNGTINATTYSGITWSQVGSKPTFAAVATSGLYSHLTGTPTTLTSFTNDLSSFANTISFGSSVSIASNLTVPTLNLSSSNLALNTINCTGTLAIGTDNNTTTINIGCASVSSQTINIGTTSPTSTINIGSTNDLVALKGSSVSLDTTSLSTSSKLLTLNSSGGVSSADACGFQIYENSNATGYIKTSADRNSFLFKPPGAYKELSINMANSNVSINNDAIFIAADGKVGIGTNQPSQTMEIAGVLKCSSVLTTSDETHKTNIQPLANSLDKLNHISGFYYDWKDPSLPSEKNVGCIAQDVLEVLPEAVRETNAGYALDYNALVALCINAIKEQQSEINILKQQISELV